MLKRNTRQQAVILEVFREAAAPLSPRGVLSEARRSLPQVGLATVYRALKGLLEEGVLAPVELPGLPVLYELAGKSHRHFFRCRKCEKMYEVQGCSELIRRLLPRGFRLETHEVFLQGLCAACKR